MSLILSTKETVSASGTGSIPGDYVSHTVSPSTSAISASGGGGTVTATYTVNPLIFPLQYVEYVSPEGGVVRVSGNDAWSRVPGPSTAPHIVKMREDTKDLVNYTLTVISKETIPAEEEGGESTEIIHSTQFTVTIFAHYDARKALITAAVNARR